MQLPSLDRLSEDLCQSFCKGCSSQVYTLHKESSVLFLPACGRMRRPRLTDTFWVTLAVLLSVLHNSTCSERCASRSHAKKELEARDAGIPQRPCSNSSRNSLASCPAWQRIPSCATVGKGLCQKNRHRGHEFDPPCRRHTCSSDGQLLPRDMEQIPFWLTPDTNR